MADIILGVSSEQLDYIRSPFSSYSSSSSSSTRARSVPLRLNSKSFMSSRAKKVLTSTTSAREFREIKDPRKSPPKRGSRICGSSSERKATPFEGGNAKLSIKINSDTCEEENDSDVFLPHIPMSPRHKRMMLSTDSRTTERHRRVKSVPTGIQHLKARYKINVRTRSILKAKLKERKKSKKMARKLRRGSVKIRGDRNHEDGSIYSSSSSKNKHKSSRRRSTFFQRCCKSRMRDKHRRSNSAPPNMEILSSSVVILTQ